MPQIKLRAGKIREENIQQFSSRNPLIRVPIQQLISARKNLDFQAFVPSRAAVIRTNPWHTHQIHEWRRLGKILIFNILPADPAPLSSKKSQDMSCLFQTWVSLELAQWHGDVSRSFYSLGLHGNSPCRWMSLPRGMQMPRQAKSGGACGTASMDSQISSFLAGERKNKSISGTPLTAASCSHLYNPFQ